MDEEEMRRAAANFGDVLGHYERTLKPLMIIGAVVWLGVIGCILAQCS
jgi:hypothetical protein